MEEGLRKDVSNVERKATCHENVHLEVGTTDLKNGDDD